MHAVDIFIDEVVADLRCRVALLDDDAARGIAEDAIVFLTDHRLGGMDDARFEKRIATFAGCARVALRATRPPSPPPTWRRAGASSDRRQRQPSLRNAR